MKTRTYLTESFFLALAGLLFASVLALVFPVIGFFVKLLWPAVFVALFGDFFSLRHSRKIQASVVVPRTPELGEELALEVSVWSSEKIIPLSRVRILSCALRTLRFEEVSTVMTKVSANTWSVTLRAKASRLGFEKLELIEVLAESAGGLWSRLIPLRVQDTSFRVIPTLKPSSEEKFRELISRQQLLFQGTRRQMRSRTPDQVHSVRKYVFPDPIRHIDHKKTARYQELMTRVYDSFFDHHVVLGLDIGRALCGSLAGSGKHDFYLAACLKLAENSFRARDRISFFSFSQRVHRLIRSSRSPEAFLPLFEGAPDLSPREEESNFDLLLPTLNQLSGQRCLFILFTDVAKPSVREAIRRTLPAVSRKHLTAVVSVLDESHALDHQLDHFLSAKPTLSNYSSLFYAYWLQDKTDSFRLELSRLGAGTLVASHRDWMHVVDRLYGSLRQSVGI